MLRGKTVSVGTTAVKLSEGKGDRGPQGVSDAGAMIYNLPGATIWIGGSDVTVNNGIPIVGGAFGGLSELGADDAVWAVVAAGTQEVRVLEIA